LVVAIKTNSKFIPQSDNMAKLLPSAGSLNRFDSPADIVREEARAEDCISCRLIGSPVQ